jgi:hypothetical protein
LLSTRGLLRTSIAYLPLSLRILLKRIALGAVSQFLLLSCIARSDLEYGLSISHTIALFGLHNHRLPAIHGRKSNAICTLHRLQHIS